MVGSERGSVLFGSVIYKNVLQYFDELINCINKQTTCDFGILFLLDGVYTEDIINKILSIRDRCIIIECGNQYSPPQLRVKLIQEAKKCGADILVIGDADDLFSDDRMGKVVNTFVEFPFADFVYNNLCFFNGNRAMPELPERVDDIRSIAEKNFLGMSNTAIRVSALSADFIESLFECSSHVFDWYLYSRLLLSGYVGMKAENTYTLYRIYEGNYVGIPLKAAEENIKREIEVKIQHYRQLKNMDSVFAELYDCYCSGKIEKADSGEDSCHYWWDFTKAEENSYELPFERLQT